MSKFARSCNKCEKLEKSQTLLTLENLSVRGGEEVEGGPTKSRKHGKIAVFSQLRENLDISGLVR